jgi:hypothetical protein
VGCEFTATPAMKRFAAWAPKRAARPCSSLQGSPCGPQAECSEANLTAQPRLSAACSCTSEVAQRVGSNAYDAQTGCVGNVFTPAFVLSQLTADEAANASWSGGDLESDADGLQVGPGKPVDASWTFFSLTWQWPNATTIDGFEVSYSLLPAGTLVPWLSVPRRFLHGSSSRQVLYTVVFQIALQVPFYFAVRASDTISKGQVRVFSAYSPSTSIALVCPSGYKITEPICEQCQANYYQDSTTSCKACPTDFPFSSPGAGDLLDCVVKSGDVQLVGADGQRCVWVCYRESGR